MEISPRNSEAALQPDMVSGGGQSCAASPEVSSNESCATQDPKPADEPYGSEVRRRDLHVSFNDRISSLCKLAALVISLVTFATTVLGHDDLRFVILGLSLSVALLAIALLQDSYHKR